MNTKWCAVDWDYFPDGEFEQDDDGVEWHKLKTGTRHPRLGDVRAESGMTVGWADGQDTRG
jgi:hypothetical protein